MDLSPSEQRDAKRAIAGVTQEMIRQYNQWLFDHDHPSGEHYEEPEDE